ncbi:MAG: DEAD/DEAH box helicase [Chloroflexi bacterium]|nr:DEAD/DEAH box helicase [Chloroflexota bacterium]
MIVLHAIWDGSKLHLWGEDSLAISPKAHTNEQRPQHPFAASSKELKRVARTLVANPPAWEIDQVSLQLPAVGRYPLPSPDLLYSAPEQRKGAKGPASFTMPALALGPVQALDFLAALPPSSPDGISTSASLRYWEEAAKFCLELLARGQFVPCTETDTDNGLRALWTPALEDPDVAERFRLLASAMPPVCRSLGGNPSTAVDILNGFLGAVIDASVRRAVPGATLPSKKGRPKYLGEKWLSSLLSEDRIFHAEGHDAAHFFQDVRQWTSQLAASTPPTAGPGAAFRTCFRLEPPADDDQPGGKQSAAWLLTFHLQALDDRSLLIEAGKVWKERSGVLTFLKRRFENPQERLLADLGRASRLYPPLEGSLKTARPVAFELPTEGAYTFLKEAAPLLEQSGLGVLVPPWWQKPSARLGVRLKVKAKKAGKSEGSASGLMGLGALVDFDWELALGDQRITRQELERMAALKVPLVQVRGQWVEFRPQQVEDALRFYQKKEGTLGEAMRLAAGVGTSPDALPIVGVEAEGRLQDIMAGVSSGSRVEELPAPGRFQGMLRPYQVKGFSWLAFLERFGLGACLADDMGLGKTIQLLALLLHERSNGVRDPGPTLLIAPMSVVGNWQREVSRFAPSLKVLVHHGTQRLCGKALARAARKNDVVISTYSLAHRDRADLSGISWRRIVLDEAQNIKNPSTRQTQAIRSLEADHRIALTGTPVENRLSELWSIMEFLNPGYLGAAEHFRSHFATPIEKYRDAERSSQLRRLVQPFLLRRLKTDPAIIQDLPQKMEMKVFCRLTREQASLYEAVVKDMMEKIEESEGMARKGLVLATLMKLKQVCNHPAHFLQDGSPLPERSGKLSRLTEMLEEVIAEGDKALVFTQFAEMGQMLKGHIQEKLSHGVLFLHGGTPRKARDDMVEQFQTKGSGPSIFVLSLKAGGLGLNLTAASHVFHFDRWWNPAVENQATDRAFRIGQKKNVQVYKYVCAGTLEERIDQMIEQKKELAESVVGTGEGWLTEMSSDQLRDVFALSREAVMEE